MRHRFVGTLVASVCALAAVTRHVHAEDTSTYVSDSFEKMARKLARQWVDGALRKACPSDKPLCGPLIEGVVSAFEALAAKDAATAQQALEATFVEATLVGGVALALPALADVDASLPGPERARAATVLRALLACTASIVRDRRARRCDLPATLADQVKQLLSGHVEGNDQAYVERFIDDVVARRAPSPETVLHVLAAVASSKAIRRDDLRVYILDLEHAVAGGLEGGLYPFVDRFLAAPDDDIDDILKGTPPQLLMTDADLVSQQATVDAWIAAAATCGGDARVKVERWFAARNVVRDEIRTKVLLGRSIPSASMAGLADLARLGCTGAGVGTLISQAQYLRASLDMYNVEVRYGPILLAIAAVVDHVRAPDPDLLATRAGAIAMRIVTGFEGTLCEALRDEATCLAVAEGRHPLCEVRLGQHLLRGDDPLALGPCYPVVHGSALAPGAGVGSLLCTSFVAGALLDGVNPTSGGQCSVPTPAAATPERIRDEVLARLLEALDGVATPQVVATVTGGRDRRVVTEALDEPERRLAQAAVRAFRLARAGDRKGAAKVIARLAVDELLTRLTAVVTDQVGVDRAACAKQTRVVTIFGGVGARCAVLLLIESAYFPIADQLWDGGLDGDTAATVATSAYRSVLASELLAGSPILLNVGLGANMIWGDSTTWGADGYRALTVVDKFGVAFYRRRTEAASYEIGPFVGGFVDAIVRTVADEPQKYWLAGLTVGTTRMFSYDLGIQVHAAAALPFVLDGFKTRTGFALGATLVVPWGDYLEED